MGSCKSRRTTTSRVACTPLGVARFCADALYPRLARSRVHGMKVIVDRATAVRSDRRIENNNRTLVEEAVRPTNGRGRTENRLSHDYRSRNSRSDKLTNIGFARCFTAGDLTNGKSATPSNHLLQTEERPQDRPSQSLNLGATPSALVFGLSKTTTPFQHPIRGMPIVVHRHADREAKRVRRGAGERLAGPSTLGTNGRREAENCGEMKDSSPVQLGEEPKSSARSLSRVANTAAHRAHESTHRSGPCLS